MAGLFIRDSAIYRLYFIYSRTQQCSCVSCGHKRAAAVNLVLLASALNAGGLSNANRFALAHHSFLTRSHSRKVLHAERSLPSKRLTPISYLNLPSLLLLVHPSPPPNPNHYLPPAYTPPPSPSSPPPSSASSACSFHHHP